MSNCFVSCRFISTESTFWSRSNFTLAIISYFVEQFNIFTFEDSLNKVNFDIDYNFEGTPVFYFLRRSATEQQNSTSSRNLMSSKSNQTFSCCITRVWNASICFLSLTITRVMFEKILNTFFQKAHYHITSFLRFLPHKIMIKG